MEEQGFENGKKCDGVIAEAAIIASKTGSTPILWFRVHTRFGFIKFEQVINKNTIDFVCEKTMWDCFGLEREAAKTLMLSGDLSSLRKTEVSVVPEYKPGRTPTEGYWEVKYMNPRFFRPKTAPPDMLARVASLFDAPSRQATAPRAVNQPTQGQYDEGAFGYSDDDVPF
jgi:hypothetical protein